VVVLGVPKVEGDAKTFLFELSFDGVEPRPLKNPPELEPKSPPVCSVDPKVDGAVEAAEPPNTPPEVGENGAVAPVLAEPKTDPEPKAGVAAVVDVVEPPNMDPVDPDDGVDPPKMDPEV